jgi:hypothetical protein
MDTAVVHLIDLPCLLSCDDVGGGEGDVGWIVELKWRYRIVYKARRVSLRVCYGCSHTLRLLRFPESFGLVNQDCFDHALPP